MVFGGPSAQVSTVKRVTGLPLEGYVLLGFSGFKKIVDDQGGLPIVIPRTVVASHAKNLVIKAGPQTLSGAEALAYARERKTLPDGDFGRSRHQGEVILAAAVKAKLAGPAAIPRALTSFSSVGKSDLSAEQILTFTAGLHTLSPLQVGRGVAKGSFGTAAGQSIVVLGAQARQLFASFRDGNLRDRTDEHRDRRDGRSPRRPPEPHDIRRARTADVRGIRDLVAPLAERGVLVSKEAVTYFESLQEFRVAELEGRIVGCGALHVMWEDLAEIRTLAVAEDLLGTGLGGRLLEELVDDARADRRPAALLPDLRGGLLRPPWLHARSRDRLCLRTCMPSCCAPTTRGSPSSSTSSGSSPTPWATTGCCAPLSSDPLARLARQQACRRTQLLPEAA